MTPAPHALEDFDRLGFCHLPGAVEPALLDALEAGVRRWEEAPDAERPAHAPRTFTPLVNEVRLLNVVECGPAFEALVDHPAILSWVRALVPGPPRLTVAQSITRGPGIGLPLHRIDTATYHADGHADGRADGRVRRCDHVTAVVWLSDVGAEDGPMVVFAGTHRSDEPLPCPSFHPSWNVPWHDLDFAQGFLAAQGSTRGVAWEAVNGYHELRARRGDLVV